MKKRLAICDGNERYRQMMQGYMIKRLKDFEILTFENIHQAKEFSRKKPFAIVLLSEQLYDMDVHEIQAMQIYILREDGKKAISQYPYIEKYQSMESMIHDIFTEYSDDSAEKIGIGHKKAKVHVFYSPVRKTEQTLAALAYGQCLAQSGKKVLYLNLQAFAGWEMLLQTTFLADITDILYFAERNDNQLEYRLQSIKKSLGGMDYFPPAQDYLDLLCIEEAKWLKFLDILIKREEYEEIVLDVSEICQGLYSILEQCDSIYSIQEIDQMQKNAVTQYQKLLEKRELHAILEKTKWINPPINQADYERNLERLYTTELGQYMKGC